MSNFRRLACGALAILTAACLVSCFKVKDVQLPLAFVTQTLPNGQVGKNYSVALLAHGGVAPYTWQIAAGSLPAGLIFSPLGYISGTPTTSGSLVSVTLRVSDSAMVATTLTKDFGIL